MYCFIISGRNEIVKSHIIVQGSKIFKRSYENTDKDAIPILLLHGAAFSSETWQEKTKTLQFLKSKGYEPFALDLPGKGNPPSDNIDDMKKSEFVRDAIAVLGISSPVVVSPSMSGSYSIPFLMIHPDEIRGFIPVAPTIPDEYSEKFSEVKVPTLIIYGENDTSFVNGRKKLLSAIPQSEIVEIPNGSHPCYLDNPDLFHKSILDFLKTL